MKEPVFLVRPPSLRFGGVILAVLCFSPAESSQVVGMSATLSNTADLQAYLRADVYSSNFRPVSTDRAGGIGRARYRATCYLELWAVGNESAFRAVNVTGWVTFTSMPEEQGNN